MVPFMESSLLVALAERLIIGLNPSDASTLDALLPVLSALRATPKAARDVCAQHFDRLLAFHRIRHLEDAGTLLADFAEGILPFGIGGRDTQTSDLQLTRFSAVDARRISALFTTGSTSIAEGRILAALVYRFPEAHKNFLSSLGGEINSALVPPLAASLDIITSMGIDAFQLSKPTDLTSLQSTLAREAPTLSRWFLEGTFAPDFIRRLGKVFYFSSRLFPSLGSTFVSALLENFKGGVPTTFTPQVLDGLRELELAAPAAEGFLTIFVESSLEWLVRRFAEDSQNTAAIEAFICALCES
jgi:hypothetical protein